MPQNSIALLHSVSRENEVVNSESLQQHRGSLRVADIRRQFHQTICRRKPLLTIGTGQAGVADAVAHLQVRHPATECFNNTRALVTRNSRHLHGIEPRSLIGIDEIHTHGSVTDADLPRPGVAYLYIVQLQHFWAARCMEANSFGHD